MDYWTTTNYLETFQWVQVYILKLGKLLDVLRSSLYKQISVHFELNVCRYLYSTVDVWKSELLKCKLFRNGFSDSSDLRRPGLVLELRFQTYYTIFI